MDIKELPAERVLSIDGYRFRWNETLNVLKGVYFDIDDATVVDGSNWRGYQELNMLSLINVIKYTGSGRYSQGECYSELIVAMTKLNHDEPLWDTKFSWEK